MKYGNETDDEMFTLTIPIKQKQNIHRLQKQ